MKEELAAGKLRQGCEMEVDVSSLALDVLVWSTCLEVNCFLMKVRGITFDLFRHG